MQNRKSDQDADSSSATLPTPEQPTQKSGYLCDALTRLVSRNPRFKMVEPSGTGYILPGGPASNKD